MRTLVIGDTHLKFVDIVEKVEETIERWNIKRVVFTGDYCDDWRATEASFEADIIELADWVEDRREEGLTVDLLFGNHDFQYLIGEPGPGTMIEEMRFVRDVLFPLELKIAAVVDDLLITHAGVTQDWADEWLEQTDDIHAIAHDLNAMLEEGAYDALRTCGPGRGGSDIPSPLWADLAELTSDPLPNIRQIVGHTPVGSCWKAPCDTLDGEPDIWACDTFSTTPNLWPIGDGSMLLVKDGVVTVAG